jgi:formyltetrahydrofolate deformylase
MKRHILLMNGPDSKGLIHKVVGVMLEFGQNIISQDEYVSPDGKFFMRTEFEGEVNSDALLASLYANLPKDIVLRLNPDKRKEIVLLVTKEHHCLAELLIRYAFNELNANIQAVVSNYNSLQPLVAKFGIPFHHISHEHCTRAEHEEKILRCLEIYQPEIIVLAKYMRILSPEFVKQYSNKIVNIHHSFLPAFIGANPYKQAFERGVKIIGATAHFVNDNLDEGPIIAQSVENVNHTFSAADMATLGRDTEKMVLWQALKLVLSDRVFIDGNKTIIL